MNFFRKDKKYLYWGATAFFVVAASMTFFLVVNKFSTVMAALGTVVNVLAPFFYGLAVAYILNKVMTPLERSIVSHISLKLFRGKKESARKFSRVVSIILVEGATLALLAALIIIMLPQIFYSIVDLIGKSSDYITIAAAWVEDFFNGDDLFAPVIIRWLNTFTDSLMSWIEGAVLPQISTLITGITGGVVSIVKVVIALMLGFVISIYLLYNKETFCAQCKKFSYSLLRPKTANKLMDEMDYINKAFGDYIVGTLLDALIVGVANYVFMLIMRMPYAELISIIVATTNIIPVFGPFIGAIPSTLLLLLENPMQCLIFVIFTVVLQQIDGNIIKARVHGARAGISGFWVTIAILFFGGLFGITGMILGVPVMTVIYSAVKRLNARRLKKRGLPHLTEEYKNIELIVPDTLEPVYRHPPQPEEAKEEETQEVTKE